MPKFTNKIKVLNQTQPYQDVFENRNVDKIVHYKTYKFNKNFDKSNYTVKSYTWKSGDRLYKLASEYYRDYRLWWVIAFWNSKPTDAHYSPGMIIEIPVEVDQIVRSVQSDS